MGCSTGKGSARRGLRGVDGDALREKKLLEVNKTGFLSSFFECLTMFEDILYHRHSISSHFHLPFLSMGIMENRPITYPIYIQVTMANHENSKLTCIRECTSKNLSPTPYSYTNLVSQLCSLSVPPIFYFSTSNDSSSTIPIIITISKFSLEEKKKIIPIKIISAAYSLSMSFQI